MEFLLLQEQLESVAKAAPAGRPGGGARTLSIIFFSAHFEMLFWSLSGRVTGNCGSHGKRTWKIEFEPDFVIHFDPFDAWQTSCPCVSHACRGCSRFFTVVIRPKSWWFQWCAKWWFKNGISMFGEWDFLKEMGFPLKIGVQSNWISNCWLENIGDHEFPMMVNYG